MKNKKNTNKKKNPRMIFFKYLSVVLLIISAICLGLIYFLNVLPMQYFIIATILFIIIDGIMCYLLLGKGWKKRMLGTILSTLLIFP